MGTGEMDFALVRCVLARADGLPEAARAFCAALPGARLHRAAWAQDGGACYVYARLAPGCALTPVDTRTLATQWQALCPAARELDVSRLKLRFDAPGHSLGQAPAWHYVVETDPEDGWEDEIDRWYDTEHMPGLAAVPGCVYARRMRNLDSGPRSLACYDLVTAETMGSPPWLAVRGTSWSDIARPHFTNTRRTLMRVLA